MDSDLGSDQVDALGYSWLYYCIGSNFNPNLNFPCTDNFTRLREEELSALFFGYCNNLVVWIHFEIIS